MEELAHAQGKLSQTAELLKLAQEAASAGIWAWDVKRDVVWLSPECARLNSVPFDPVMHRDGVEVPVRTWLAHVHDGDKARVVAENRRAIKERDGFEVELRIARSATADEGYRWLHSIGKVVLDHTSGEPLRVVGFDADITRRKDDEARIVHMARHDGLTGLLNRGAFYELLEGAIGEAERGGFHLSILAIDLDRFKWVNDTYGHPLGDALLRRVAASLKATVLSADVVARLGGDEFAVIRLCSGEQSNDDFAAQLIEAVNARIILDGLSITVGASVGIAVYPKDALDAENLLKAADLALRTVKKSNCGSFGAFTKGMLESERRRYELEQDLRLALEKDEFELHYQPICEARHGQVVQFEALLRWRHPIRGLITPSKFIAVSEETGLIVPIGAWVLQSACTAARSWPERVGVAVNVSAVQLKCSSFPLKVASALATSGLSPDRLELEITETALMQEPRASGCVEDLRSLGVTFALDDFGTGFSSLSYLLDLDFDRIKLDRSFVTDIGNERAKTIVRSVVKMGKALGMKVTAEGVETFEQFGAARSYGCTELQGYLIGSPSPAAVAPHGWAPLGQAHKRSG